MRHLRRAKLPVVVAIVGLLPGALNNRVVAQAVGIESTPATEQVLEHAEQAPPSLDFEAYRTLIEPIFLKKREGRVRCYDCHSIQANRLKLQPLPEGSASWTEDQSRRNFEVVSHLVNLTDPLTSHLLLHPL